MTRAIYKYPVHHALYPIEIPKGAVLRHVGEQHGIPTLWIEIDPDAETRAVNIITVGTGHPVPQDGHFLGTVMLGAFVFHLFSEETLA